MQSVKMPYHYTETEIKQILQSLTIVVDSRENSNQPILDYFQKKKVPYITQKLDFADYSCFIPANSDLGIMRDTYLDCFIERKGSIEELSSNMCNDRDRLQSEFLRAKGNRLIMMIEEQAGFEKIIEHKYNTQYNEKSFIASLFSFGHRYNIDINFVAKQYAGMFIYMQLYYFARNELK